MSSSLSSIFPKHAKPTEKRKYPPPVSLRLTPEEREQLEQDAGDLTLSAYIRLCLFGKSIPKHRTRGKRPIKDHEALAIVLNHFVRSNIANNLNQLTKAVNGGTLRPTDDVAATLKDTQRHVLAIRHDLIKALGLKENDQ